MSNIKIPTLEEKVEIYEKFLHKINLYCVCMNNDGIRQLIENADSWSYAHRRELPEDEIDLIVNSYFWKLCEVNSAHK